MSKIDAEIEQLEIRLEQRRQRLRDLKAQAAKQDKRNQNRRIYIYGAAFLALLERLEADKRQQTLDRIHQHVTRAPDRKFLDLPEITEESSVQPS